MKKYISSYTTQTQGVCALRAYFIIIIFLCPASRALAQHDTFNIGKEFIASGWMGDGEMGTRHLQLDEVSRENPHTGTDCIKVVYTPGPVGWAGIYWQNEADNWGDQPGENFNRTGYRHLTFWTRGAKGGEVVEFAIGGIEVKGKKYKDSFKAQTRPRKITLHKEWTRYTIGLGSEDLSSVIGGFAWVATASSNHDGLTFYLDDIYLER